MPPPSPPQTPPLHGPPLLSQRSLRPHDILLRSSAHRLPPPHDKPGVCLHVRAPPTSLCSFGCQISRSDAGIPGLLRTGRRFWMDGWLRGFPCSSLDAACVLWGAPPRAALDKLARVVVRSVLSSRPRARSIRWHQRFPVPSPHPTPQLFKRSVRIGFSPSGSCERVLGMWTCG